MLKNSGISLTLLLLLSGFSFSQSNISFDDIKPIIISKCVTCHKSNGVAPFPLNTYSDVRDKSEMIKYVLENDLMPPWHTDTTFRKFRNQIVLTKTEKTNILKWISSGTLGNELKSTDIDEIPNKETNTIAAVDLVFGMDKPYNVQPKSVDEFTWFHIPNVFKDSTFIKRIELKTSDPKVEHHGELFSNPISDWPIEFEYSTPTKKNSILTSVKNTESGVSLFNNKQFLSGRFPGTDAWQNPRGIINVIPPNHHLIFYGHYGPIASEEKDSASIEITFATKDSGDRISKEIGIHGFKDLISGQFYIPKDSIKTFYTRKVISEDVSVYSILPHAHHICKKMKAYAVSPIGDTIQLIKIDKWVFEWQFLYQLDKFIILPKNSKLYFEATYDNTINNPSNPNYPPVDVKSSMNANDEMMDLFLHVVPYRIGDEDAVLNYNY